MRPEVPLPYTRPLCSTCLRPSNVCYCAQVTQIHTSTRVIILQHPRERHVPINTARIAALCLPEARVRIAVDFADDPVLQRALADTERPPVLLFPSADAVNPSTHPPEHPVTLIVIDGTWPQAEKILKANPALRALPCYALSPAAPSNYRIRREPAENYVCTIEAMAAMLAALERDASVEQRLLAPFNLMVDTQVHYAETVHASRHRKFADPNKVRPPKYVPSELTESPEKLVFVWGEASAWPTNVTDAPEATLVHWIAERNDASTRFEAFLRPVGPLSPAFEQHTRLHPDRVLAGESQERFQARWSEFLRPGDIIVTWGLFALELLRRREVSVAQTLDLRDAVKRHLHARVGSIENAVQLMHGAPEPHWADGRAGLRLAALRALATALVSAGH